MSAHVLAMLVVAMSYGLAMLDVVTALACFFCMSSPHCLPSHTTRPTWSPRHPFAPRGQGALLRTAYVARAYVLAYCRIAFDNIRVLAYVLAESRVTISEHGKA